jgi:hypothetical protein
MPLDLEMLQIFLGARLQPMDETLSRMEHLTIFDQFVYWQVWWEPESEFLRIAAENPPPGSVPVVEVEGYYSELSVFRWRAETKCSSFVRMALSIRATVSSLRDAQMVDSP